jgi:hypothetical protein
MNERIGSRRWPIAFATLLALGVFALVASLTSDLSLGLMAVGVLAILLVGFVPAARKYCFGEAEQRVVTRNAPAFCLMLALVWIVPALLGYFKVVPQEAVFMLAFAAFWLVGMPVLGWHHASVLEARRELEREAGVAQTAPAGPAGTNAPEPKPAASTKGLAVSLLGYWWSLIPGAIVGALLLMSALQISGKLGRTQFLQITNTGSPSVDIRNASASWGDNRVLTLHPGTSGFWMFRDGDQFRITRSDEPPPKPGTTPPASPLPSRSETSASELTQNPDGSGTIAIKHTSRTAEVRVNEAGKIEFEFTDL